MKYFLLTLALLFSTPFSMYALEAKLILSNDYAYQDKFYATPESYTPTMHAVKHAYIHQKIILQLLVHDFALNQANRADVNYTITITSPDGSIYSEHSNLVVTNAFYRKEPPLILAENKIMVVFEPQDKQGIYKITTTVYDSIGKQEKHLSENLHVKAYTYQTHEFNDDTLAHWMQRYNINPEPEKAIAAFQQFSKTPRKDAISHLAFFEQILNANPFLMPVLIHQFKTLTENGKIQTLYLLRQFTGEKTKLIDQLSPILQIAYEGICNEPEIDPFGDLKHPAQLDQLWNIFFATGEKKAIDKLIQHLSFIRYERALPDKRKPTLNAAFYGAVKWSMTSNCQQFPLVRAYCVHSLLHDLLDPEVEKELYKILLTIKKRNEGIKKEETSI